MFFFSFFLCFLIFNKKLLVLLLLELCFLSCISLYFFSFPFLLSSLLFVLFFFMLFLVMDSVMGISLLLSISRCNGPHVFFT